MLLKQRSRIITVTSGTLTLGGAGGAGIVLHTEIFLSLLSSEGASPGILDSLVQENFSGGSDQTPKFALHY